MPRPAPPVSLPQDIADLQPLALMDAECAICSAGARMIHRLDRSGTIRICPIQTQTGRAGLLHLGLDSDDPDTWLFIAEGTVWRDLDALAEIGRRSGGWGHLLRLLLILPRPVRDWFYTRLARNRYTLFGRGDMCAIPDPAFQRRLVR